jgi:hypothetical protein
MENGTVLSGGIKENCDYRRDNILELSSPLDELDDSFTEGILTGIPEGENFLLPTPKQTNTIDYRGSDNVPSYHQNETDYTIEQILPPTPESKPPTEIEIVDLTEDDRPAESSAVDVAYSRSSFGHFQSENQFSRNEDQFYSRIDKNIDKTFRIETDFTRMKRHNIFIRYVKGFSNSGFQGLENSLIRCRQLPSNDDLNSFSSNTTCLTDVNNELNRRKKSEISQNFESQNNQEVKEKQSRLNIEAEIVDREPVPGDPTTTNFGHAYPIVPAAENNPFQNPTLDADNPASVENALEDGDGECLVCGANAGRHIHYGGQSCYSCKAFFRRAVIDNTYPNFKCATKSCSIDSKSWRSCKWCRFQKCLSSGLKPSWVLEKKERKRRHATKMTFVTRVQHAENVIAQAMGPVTQGGSMVWGYSADELSQLMILANGVHRDLTKNLLHFYGHNPTLFGKVTRFVHKIK